MPHKQQPQNDLNCCANSQLCGIVPTSNASQGRFSRRDVLLIREDAYWNLLQQHHVPQVRVFVYEDGAYDAQTLLISLRDIGFADLQMDMLFAFDQRQKLAIYLGEKPFAESVRVPISTPSTSPIVIKARQRKVSECSAYTYTQNTERTAESVFVQNDNDDEIVNNNNTNNYDDQALAGSAPHKDATSSFLIENRVPRQKERTIDFAQSIVKKWRDIFENGHLAHDGTVRKVNLDQAAKIVGMSRKTLDDYRSHIKRGEDNGFNFDAHQNCKIGILRAFNEQRADVCPCCRRAPGVVKSEFMTPIAHNQQQYQHAKLEQTLNDDATTVVNTTPTGTEFDDKMMRVDDECATHQAPAAYFVQHASFQLPEAVPSFDAYNQKSFVLNPDLDFDLLNNNNYVYFGNDFSNFGAAPAAQNFDAKAYDNAMEEEHDYL